MSNTGSKTLPLYNKARHVRFDGKAVYTNLPVGGAYRGYGGTQGAFPLEMAMDEVAERLGLDPVELPHPQPHPHRGDLADLRGAGRGPQGGPADHHLVRPRRVHDGSASSDSAGRESAPSRAATGPIRRGVGMSVHMQGSGIPLIDMAAATMTMNDDGSFNLLVGATDLGTGSDTILAQIAAEVLGVPLDRIVVVSSDTDLTPFDTGAYASSTTYVSGKAVERAAREVRDRDPRGGRGHARGRRRGRSTSPTAGSSPRDGRGVDLADIGHRSYYGPDQFQIAATASFVPESPRPPVPGGLRRGRPSTSRPG